MKKITIVLFILFLAVKSFAGKEAYKIKVKIKGMENATGFLANYYGNKQYYKDTAQADANGVLTFTGEEPLPGGIYSIVTPGMKYFEIVVNEAIIEIETDTLDFVKNMVIKKSKENELFYGHLRFIGEKQKESQPLRDRYNKEGISEKEKKQLADKLAEIDEEVKTYRLNLIKNNPNTFVAVIFRTMKEPEAPSFEEEKNDSIIRFKRYRYMKEHFFDGVDFTDDRLIRTPLYHNKIQKYFKQLVSAHPDSINKEADWIISKTIKGSELFKYTVHYITNTYETSKIMGMDAVFVHMALNYYTHELAFWVDSAQVKKIRERAEKLEPLLMGKEAINLMLLDTSGKNWVNMHKIQAEYTVLVFWDPECGHCKTELPKLAKYYETIKSKGVAVYAVSSDHNEAWKKFIRENSLDFLNVAVPKDVYEDQQKATEYILQGLTDLKSLNYNKTYDIYSTPQIYLLDKDKVIIAKKLETELLKKVLEGRWEKKGVN